MKVLLTPEPFRFEQQAKKVTAQQGKNKSAAQKSWSKDLSIWIGGP